MTELDSNATARIFLVVEELRNEVEELKYYRLMDSVKDSIFFLMKLSYRFSYSEIEPCIKALYPSVTDRIIRDALISLKTYKMIFTLDEDDKTYYLDKRFRG